MSLKVTLRCVMLKVDPNLCTPCAIVIVILIYAHGIKVFTTQVVQATEYTFGAIFCYPLVHGMFNTSKINRLCLVIVVVVLQCVKKERHLSVL